MSDLESILARIENWDGDVHDICADWMSALKYPVDAEEPLDIGMSALIRLMNIEGKMHTQQSCMHDPGVVFIVEDEHWFEEQALPLILAINDDDFIMVLKKIYFGKNWGNADAECHWIIEPSFQSGWYQDKEWILQWYEGVYKAFERICHCSPSGQSD